MYRRGLPKAAVGRDGEYCETYENAESRVYMNSLLCSNANKFIRKYICSLVLNSSRGTDGLIS